MGYDRGRDRENAYTIYSSYSIKSRISQVDGWMDGWMATHSLTHLFDRYESNRMYACMHAYEYIDTVLDMEQ